MAKKDPDAPGRRHVVERPMQLIGMHKVKCWCGRTLAQRRPGVFACPRAKASR